MRKINLIILLTVFSYTLLWAQKKGETGFIAGASFYLGEINPEKLFYSPGLAYGISYRQNLNSRYSASIQLLKLQLSGNDTDFKNIYQQTRNHSFQTNLIDLSLQIEFNFLPFKRGSGKEFITPYVFGGGGLSYGLTQKSGIKPVIPFGIGIKIAPWERACITINWSMRKTFTDVLDNLNPDSYDVSPGIIPKQRSYNNSNDWYSIAGISLSVQLYNPDYSCPAYRR